MTRGAWLLLAVAACGDNLPDPGTPHSGSRLKLAWYEYEGGAREREASWYYDAELAQRCTPARWSDGHRYCAPATDDAVYVSDTCTRALGRTLIGLTPAPYFATTFAVPDESLPLRSRLFERGAPALEPVAVWRKGTAGCVRVELSEGYEYFELGAERPAAELSQLQRSDPRGIGALAVIDETSDDGLSVPIALYDRDAASECATRDRPNAEATECLATSAASAAYYHDAACSEPVAAVEDAGAPAFALQYDVATSCYTQYHVGGEVDAPPLFERAGPSCLESAPPGGQRFFSMTEPRRTPALARTPEPTQQRIRAIRRTSDELHVPDPLMFDAELGTDCAHDASMRCAPRTEAVVWTARQLIYFSDPACRAAMTIAYVPSGSCDPRPRFATDGENYYPLLDPYPGPIYVPSTGDTCSAYAVPVPFVAYAVGDPIDRATLATAKLTIDP